MLHSDTRRQFQTFYSHVWIIVVNMPRGLGFTFVAVDHVAIGVILVRGVFRALCLFMVVVNELKLNIF